MNRKVIIARRVIAAALTITGVSIMIYLEVIVHTGMIWRTDYDFLMCAALLMLTAALPISG